MELNLILMQIYILFLIMLNMLHKCDSKSKIFYTHSKEKLQGNVNQHMVFCKIKKKPDRYKFESFLKMKLKNYFRR